LAVQLDRIELAYFERSVGQVRASRTAYVSDVPTGSPDSVLKLALGQGGLPQIGDDYPSEPGCKLVRARAETPQGGDGSQSVVYLDYETVQSSVGGLPGAPFVVSDGSDLISDETQLVPGLLQNFPLRATWINPNNDRDVVSDILTISITRPLRTLVLEGIVKSRPSAALLDAHGAVNEKPWQGKPKGYWKFADLKTRTTDRGLTYSVMVAMQTKGTEDWSTYGVMKDHNEGKFVEVHPNDIKTAKGKEYAHGMIWSTNGLLRVGPYPLADFQTIFGV
jgi:hypothetical protein